MLILSRRELEAVLAGYVEHYSAHRPHRSLGQRAPSPVDSPPAPIGDVDPAKLSTRTRFRSDPHQMPGINRACLPAYVA